MCVHTVQSATAAATRWWLRDCIVSTHKYLPLDTLAPQYDDQLSTLDNLHCTQICTKRGKGKHECGDRGAGGSLATKLHQLLHGDYKLQKGVRKQVELLSRELYSIYAFLCKVSDVPWDRLDEQVKVWASEVREASYDMEDIIDTFLVRVDSGKNNTDSSRLKLAMTKMGELFTKAMARRDIARKIEDITRHLEEVADRRQKYKLDEIMCKPLTATSTVDPRLKSLYKEVTQLIGVEKSRDMLISMLQPSQSDDAAPGKKKITKKVSIVGVGGLSKTTLAKLVYDNLYSHYDCAAFVSVGRDLDLVKVFKDILFQLDNSKYENIHTTGRGVDLLISELREFLQNKRYLVVLDDVWEVQSWEIIKLALVENNCGSKVITTTRDVDVSKEAGEVYKLKPLSYDDSMKLFYTRISGASGKCLHKILRTCAGIPLAIITMTSLLAGKSDCEWYEVYNSIGSRPNDNREVEDTMMILSFSYYDLPPYLRTCLLYLSKYPEDYLIEKEPLIWNWIAEGFIDGKQGTRLFDLGEGYFNYLINRSLIQVEETWDGRVLGCRVHDMVLDLMRKVSFEENFITLLDDNIEGTPAPSSVHRLAHHHRTFGHINSEAKVTGMEKLRSYTALMCCIDNQDLFLRFKLLRVLDIFECSFKEGCHLEHLGDLLHLRYLGIRKCRGCVPKLPGQIVNLKLLRTLDVDINLPASIIQLTKLVRLCAEHTYAPDGIGNLTSLEVLRIGNTKRFMKELGHLRKLRVLEFSSGEMDETMPRDFVESLHNLKKIEHIVLGCFASRADATMWEAAGFVLPRPLRYLHLLIYFSKMPSCINPLCLPNLSHLILQVNTMDEQDLKILASLPMLCFLYLGTKSTLTASNINVSDGCFFQKLRFFKTNQMVQFEQPHEDDASISFHMWNGEGSMPFGSRKSSNSSKVVPSCMMPNLEVLTFDVRLRALKVNNGDCANIGIEYLPSLQKLSGWIHCDGVPPAEGGAALAALGNACMVHPNNPTLDMCTYNKGKKMSTEDQEDEKQQEEVASQMADIDLGKRRPGIS